MKNLLIILLSFVFINATEQKTELGLGIVSMYYPNYIGSKSNTTLTLPFPHIRYKNDYFNINEDGINGKLFGIKGLSLDLSISGSFPSESDDTGLRKDMPDLDFTGEVGPKLVYNIYKNSNSTYKFELPARIVLSTDLTNIKYQGINYAPEFQYSYTKNKFKLFVRNSLVFANSDYHNYFYEVKKEYVTTNRRLYKSSAGFSGFRNSLGGNYQNGNWWFGGFVANFNISKAVFEDSPMIETKNAYYVGISAAYIFYTAE